MNDEVLARMKTCPSCGSSNTDTSDFCLCGEYLRWEPTLHIKAVSAPSADAAQPRLTRGDSDNGPQVGPEHRTTLAPGHGPAQIDGFDSTASTEGIAVTRNGTQPDKHGAAATLLLRRPEEDAPPAGTVSTSVVPGERTTLLASIRNESAIVDNYDLSVRGLPDGWWTVSPATAYLVPYGAEGDYEQDSVVDIHPPRAPEAEARSWPFDVVAVSRARGGQIAAVAAALVIEPYEQVTASVAPDRAAGRLKASYVLTVRNHANVATTVAMAAEDGEGECQFRFAESAVIVPAGRGVEAPFRVYPPKQIWLGRAKERSIRVIATPVGSEEPSTPVSVAFRQRAWLPWWLALIAPLAAAIVAVALLLLPKQVVVPNLKTAGSVFAAEKLAARAGLKVAPQPEADPHSNAPAGSIVDQAPEPGHKLRRGGTVLLRIALGSGMEKVPSVVGMTPVAADTALLKNHFQLGVVSPQPPDPNGEIASQYPAGGTQAPDGTAVSVFLKTKAPAPQTNTSGGSGASGAGGHGGPAKAVAVPALSGSVAAAGAQLAQLGLVPTFVHKISRASVGQVIGTSPASGSWLPPGTTVQVLVSAGFPQLAYDDGHHVYVVNPLDTKTAWTSPFMPIGEEAAWTVDGGTLLFVQGAQPPAAQLWSAAPGQQGASPTQLTDLGSDVRDPSVAPNGKVLAFIDRSQGHGRLCFAAISPLVRPLNTTSDCTSLAGFDLGRQVSWSSDGTRILVSGTLLKDNTIHRLVQFHTSYPFSPNATAWDQGTPVTDPARDVIAGAFSPDGNSLALVSDTGQPAHFQVYLTSPTQFDPLKATVLGGEACQVAWRSDSLALAVMRSTAGCTADASGAYPPGDIFIFDITNPNNAERVASNAENPVWQPIQVDG